jgi:hypothetical protein
MKWVLTAVSTSFVYTSFGLSPTVSNKRKSGRPPRPASTHA